MKLISNIVLVIGFVFGALLFYVNAKRVYDGCPTDQVRINTVGAFECIRR